MTEKKEIVLTEKILAEAKVEGKLKTPRALSWEDKEYRKYTSRMTISDIEELCKILQHSVEEIYAERIEYGEINFGEERCYIGSWKVRDILLEIKNGRWNKNDILYDVSLLLSPRNYSEHASLRVKVYNYLLKEEYIEIDRDWLQSINK